MTAWNSRPVVLTVAVSLFFGRAITRPVRTEST